MFCTECRYELSHLAGSRCPECGRRFDPHDPSTFEHSAHRPCPWLIRIAMALSFYPIAVVLCLYATWAAGRIVLGHWPIPYTDDPKYIGSVAVDAFSELAVVLLKGIPFAFLATIALLIAGLVNGFRKRGANPWLSLYVMIWFVAAWVGSALYLRWDPLRVADWFFD